MEGASVGEELGGTRHAAVSDVLWRLNTSPNYLITIIYRVPLVMITFIFLWGLVMWLLDRTKVDYGFVLSKSGNCDS